MNTTPAPAWTATTKHVGQRQYVATCSCGWESHPTTREHAASLARLHPAAHCCEPRLRNGSPIHAADCRTTR